MWGGSPMRYVGRKLNMLLVPNEIKRVSNEKSKVSNEIKVRESPSKQFSWVF